MNRRDFLKTSFLGSLAATPLAKIIATASGSSKAQSNLAALHGSTAYDVAVFGAGVSGICAALQCARLGKRTLLVEKGALPGGAITLNRIELPAIFAVKGKRSSAVSAGI